jgi:hypothetical protein
MTPCRPTGDATMTAIGQWSCPTLRCHRRHALLSDMRRTSATRARTLRRDGFADRIEYSRHADRETSPQPALEFDRPTAGCAATGCDGDDARGLCTDIQSSRGGTCQVIYHPVDHCRILPASGPSSSMIGCPNAKQSTTIPSVDEAPRRVNGVEMVRRNSDGTRLDDGGVRRPCAEAHLRLPRGQRRVVWSRPRRFRTAARAAQAGRRLIEFDLAVYWFRELSSQDALRRRRQCHQLSSAARY